MKKIVFIFTLNIHFFIFSQTVFYQDIWKGGVCFSGFSAGITSNTTINGQFETFIEPNSTIKKVFLIYNTHNSPDSNISIILDNINIQLSAETVFFEKHLESQFTDFYFVKNNIVDITSIYQNVFTHTIQIPDQSFLNCDYEPNCFYGNFGILILYENDLLDELCFTLVFNNQNLNQEITNYSVPLNTVDTLSDIGFSLNTDIIASSIFNDGSVVYVEGQNLGLIGGADLTNSIFDHGTRGHFYYQNSTLYGLDDDTPDNLMGNSDALAQISGYILASNSLNWSLKWQVPSVPQNVYTSFNIAYSTPCQPQNVSITPDTTICPNAPFQLSASGGIAYEWLPEVGLSCYDCPNPVFSGDSSRLYTVRIWGSDSCSVVRPVMIHVRKQPKTTFYNQTTTLCGEAQALINWQTAGNNSYSLNDGVFQSTGVFNQVAAGNQLLTVRDAFGCRFDTVVAIDSYLVVDAGLLVSPTSGVAPLEIQIANQSTNFTDWSWRVNDVIQSKVNPTFQAVTGGNYEIELIAWQNDSTCADTAVQNVFISETGFYIFGSSLVVGSSISQNAFFVYTNGKPMIDISMYDAQGRLLKTNTKIQLTEGANAIWNSSEMVAIASEMVFYKINWNTASDSGELEGKAVVLR